MALAGRMLLLPQFSTRHGRWLPGPTARCRRVRRCHLAAALDCAFPPTHLRRAPARNILVNLAGGLRLLLGGRRRPLGPQGHLGAGPVDGHLAEGVVLLLNEAQRLALVFGRAAFQLLLPPLVGVAVDDRSRPRGVEARGGRRSLLGRRVVLRRRRVARGGVVVEQERRRRRQRRARGTRGGVRRTAHPVHFLVDAGEPPVDEPRRQVTQSHHSLRLLQYSIAQL